jgi:hypothetical protein
VSSHLLGYRYPPQTLFKYQKIDKYSLQNLETRSIYFNAPSHFNDLFDCTISARFLEPTAEVLEAMRETYIHEFKDYPLASSQFAEYSREQLKEFLKTTLLHSSSRRMLSNFWICIARSRRRGITNGNGARYM